MDFDGKMHIGLTERICRFIGFCLIIVCNLQKASVSVAFLHGEFLYSTSKETVFSKFLLIKIFKVGLKKRRSNTEISYRII